MNNEPPTNRRDAVETFKDLTKLIITLSSGIYVLSPAFLGLIEFNKIGFLIFLFLSWAFLLFSIIFGWLVLSSLAGSQNSNDYDIDNNFTSLFSRSQWISFFVGILFFGIFVGTNLYVLNP